MRLSSLIFFTGVIAIALPVGHAQASGKNRAERPSAVVTKPIESSSSKLLKKKHLQPSKTPTPAGPVPIPYPN